MQDIRLEPVPQDILEIAATAARASGARQVILFGSTARGEAKPESDLDLLLIVDDHASPSEAALKAHGAFWPVPRALDLVPMRRSHFEAGASALARVVAREGIVVFSSPSP